jgi:acyl-CoA thioester hydrolase
MALRLYEGNVTAAWVDELDHMNFLEYQRVADIATGRFFELLSGTPGAPWVPGQGLDAVIIETRVCYQRELRLGAELAIDTTLGGVDERRFHLLHVVSSGGRTACTVEVLLLAFDLDSRRAARWSPPAAQQLDAFARAHPAPPDVPQMPWLKAAAPGA